MKKYICISALLMALCLLMASVPAMSESHSEAWLDNWARELLEETLEQPVSAEQPEIPLRGKMILAYKELNGKCNVYGKYSMMAKEDPHPEDPFFQPVVSTGQPVLPEVPASCWAESVEECDWLIIYGGYETSRTKGYYGGNIDRVVVETRVHVLDPREKRIVLTEIIGSDVPGIRTTNPTGRVKFDEAEACIVKLLTGEE